MTQVTPTQRTAYRRALIKKGVPKVYAWMAAENLYFNEWAGGDPQEESAGYLIQYGFLWGGSSEDWFFWKGIHEECEDLGI